MERDAPGSRKGDGGGKRGAECRLHPLRAVSHQHAVRSAGQSTERLRQLLNEARTVSQ